jgi:hypothetical protein
VGRTNDARERLCAELTAAGIAVCEDSRNARPGVVVVEPPVLTRSTFGGAGTQLICEFTLYATAPPPGNLDALKAQLELVDAVINVVPATAAQPTEYVVGSQSLPAYSITVQYPAY